MGVVLAPGMTGSVSLAQEFVDGPDPDGDSYVSRGMNSHQDWGTFVLRPGDGGRALYLMGGNLTPINAGLQFTGVFQSQDQPWVHYWVYREAAANAPNKKVRQWAFQVDHPGLNGFVIYYKDDGSDPFVAQGWVMYDFAP
jgi:hypothetical protein